MMYVDLKLNVQTNIKSGIIMFLIEKDLFSINRQKVIHNNFADNICIQVIQLVP